MSSASDTKETSEAYDQLVADYQQRIFFFIRSMVFNKEEARDILQDVNIILYKKQSYYVQGTNFKSWAFTIARFECLNYLKRIKKNNSISIDNELEEKLANEAEEMAEEANPHLKALKNCMQKLSDSAKRLVAIRYNSKTTLEDAAEEQNTTPGALKLKLYRIRAKLKKCIESS